jgi:hypothetical protein
MVVATGRLIDVVVKAIITTLSRKWLLKKLVRPVFLARPTF